MNILDLLEGGRSTLILAHHNADIDAVGASIALYEFLEEGKADLGVPDSVSKGARNLASDYEFISGPSTEKYDTLVILDCPSKEQIEPIDIEDFEGRSILIDHHSPGNLKDMVDEAWTDAEARSTSEMVYELLDGKEVTERTSKSLICGTVADTSHLRLAGSKQFRYISELLEKGDAEYSEILSILHTPTAFSERVARIKAASRIDAYRLGKKVVTFSEVGSFEAASARSILKTGADIAIVFSARDNEMRISARARRSLKDEIHLGEDLFSELEEVIDGSAGGHDSAASANGKNMDVGKIKEAMLGRLEEIFGSGRERL